MPNLQLQLNVGQTEFEIVTTTDPNAISADIELNINTTATTVGDAEAPGAVRFPRKSEVILALEMMINQLTKEFPNE